MTLCLRPATPAEQPTVMQLLYDTVAWLEAQGSDQWSTWRTWETKMADAFARGDVWLLLDGADPIGTISVEFGDNGVDLEFWTADEAADLAAYVSKMTVTRDRAGERLGETLLAWAQDYAWRRGARWVRLDAWRSATRLHEYYREAGWPQIRTVELAHRNSGALFARRAAAHPEVHHVLTDQSLTAATTLPTEMSVPAERVDPSGNGGPAHLHHGGVQYQLPYTWAERPQWASWWPGYRYRVRDDGGQKVAEIDRTDHWERIGTVTSTEFDQVSGVTYVITHQGTWPDCRMILDRTDG